MVKEGQDVTWSNGLKRVSSKVIIDENYYYYYYNHFTAPGLCPGIPASAGTRKVQEA